MPTFKCDVDMSTFNKTMGEYLKWNKRQPAEIVNAKLYFIALRAKNETKAADPLKIRNDLSQPATDYPDRSIAEILTAIQLRNKGKKVSAKQFNTQVEKFIKRRQSHTNFLKSGWIPAIKKLDFWNRKGDIRFVKRFAPKDNSPKAKQYGVAKGDVLPARLEAERVWGTIINFVGQGKQASPTVKKNLLDGLRKGVNAEVVSMRQYITKKFTEKHQNMRSNSNNGVR